MSSAAIPLLLRHKTDFGNVLLQKILKMKYDPRDIPVEEKIGATVGMYAD